MEKLDVYDENMNYIGVEDREKVHQKGLWHKTIHCWLYDELGNVYFQIRKDSQKLYTTASGHVLAGETINEAFHREVMEEVGLNIELVNAELVEISVWKMDKIKNGEMFIDRAFSNVYINLIDKDYTAFDFDTNEVLGVVKVKAKDCLELLCGNISSVDAYKITPVTGQNVTLTTEDFLVQAGEIALIKYGRILQNVIRTTGK